MPEMRPRTGTLEEMKVRRMRISHMKCPGSEVEKGVMAGAEGGRETGEQGQLRARAQPQPGGGFRCECDWEPISAFEEEEEGSLGYFL